MFVPPLGKTSGAKFYRNSAACGIVGLMPQCKWLISDYRYTYGCLTKSSFTLTISAENMTEYEQGSVWRCEFPGSGYYRSPDVILNVSSK